MKKFRPFYILIFTIALLAAAIPFAFSATGTDEYANSDSETFYNNLVYAVSPDNGYIYYGESDSQDTDYLTNYKVNQLAISNGTVYLSKGDEIRTIDLGNGKDTLYYKADSNVDRFAVSEDGVYILTDGSIYLVPGRNQGRKNVIISGIITSFWLESETELSYMTDETYVYTRNIVTKAETAEVNSSSYLGDVIPIEGSNDPDNKNQATGTIGDLRKNFPAGTYWNHIGGSNDPDKVTDTPCGHHGSCSFTGSCGCNSFSSAIQCMGYAYKCGYDVSGSNPRYWTTSTSSSSIDSVKAGDIIRYRNDGHSIYVIGVSGDTITFTDCNWDGHCGIRWNATVSKSTVKSSFTNLRIASSEAEGGYTSDPEKYTVSFNANGGSVSTTSVSVYSGNAIGEMPVPTREGYTFDGWFDSASGGNQVYSTAKVTYSRTLYAHWTVITYTVSFDLNGGMGTVPASFTRTYGSGAVNYSAKAPTRTGYTFKEWNTAADGSGTGYKTSGTYSENADAVFYANWTGNSYSLYFDVESGTVSPTNIKVTYGSPYGDMPVPEREGYNFTGWYTSGGDLITSGSIVSFTGSQRLYAHWEVKKYTITYNGNNNNAVTSVPNSQQKTHNISINLETQIPVCEGYIFLGWNTASNGSGLDYAPGGAYATNADCTLYAKWKKIEYTVSFASGGGSGSMNSVIKYYGDDLAIPACGYTIEGYKCAGWIDSDGKEYKDGYYTANKSTTLTPEWEEITYIITYDVNEGKGTISDGKKKYFSESTAITSEEPTRQHYSFTGWNTKEDGSGTAYFKNDPYTENADITLYAQWLGDQVTVNLITSHCGIDNPASIKLRYGSSYSLLPETTKAGYNFDGWYTAKTGGTKYRGIVELTEETTMYLHLKPKKFTAKFDTVYSDTIYERLVEYDNKYNLVFKDHSGTSYEVVSLETPVRTGYTFNGWYTSESGGSQIKSDDIVKILETTTYYAHWTANKYIVTFDMNATGLKNETRMVTFDSAYGDIPAPERTGYVFAGWFTEKGGNKEVRNNTTVTTASDHTLYAAWVPAVYTVNLDPQGGKCGTTAVPVGYGEAYGTLPTPTREGYSFAGWYTSPSGGTQVTESTVFTGNSSTTLYALWRANTYTLTFADGSSKTSKPVKYLGKVADIPEATGTGFAGWYTDDGTEITEESVYSFSKSITATAVYTDTSADKVSFVADGKIIAEVSSDNLSAGTPDVPEKEGYTGKWAEVTGTVYKATYAPKKYTLTTTVSGTSTKTEYSCGDVITLSTPDAPEGYVFSGWSEEIPAVMPAKNVSVTAEFSPVTYYAVLIVDGKTFGRVAYTADSTSLDLPEADGTPGYTYTWNDYTITAGGMNITSSRTINTYKAVFVADGVTQGSVDYTVESTSISEPEVPEKAGYTGKWSEYNLEAGGITINAVYTPKTYSVKFMFKDETTPVATVKYKYGATSIKEPDYPVRPGYIITGWGSYDLSKVPDDDKAITVKAVYTYEEYTATFTDGVNDYQITFTLADNPIKIPDESPIKGHWPTTAPEPHDMTIYPEFSHNHNPTIGGYVATRQVDYRTTITFTAKVSGLTEDCSVHWFINGVDQGEGNGDGTFTVKEAKESFTVQVKLYCKGVDEPFESITETVKVKDTFFQKVIAFFRSLFGKLPVIKQ